MWKSVVLAIFVLLAFSLGGIFLFLNWYSHHDEMEVTTSCYAESICSTNTSRDEDGSTEYRIYLNLNYILLNYTLQKVCVFFLFGYNLETLTNEVNQNFLGRNFTCDYYLNDIQKLHSYVNEIGPNPYYHESSRSKFSDPYFITSILFFIACGAIMIVILLLIYQNLRKNEDNDQKINLTADENL